MKKFGSLDLLFERMKDVTNCLLFVFCNWCMPLLLVYDWNRELMFNIQRPMTMPGGPGLASAKNHFFLRTWNVVEGQDGLVPLDSIFGMRRHPNYVSWYIFWCPQGPSGWTQWWFCICIFITFNRCLKDQKIHSGVIGVANSWLIGCSKYNSYGSRL